MANYTPKDYLNHREFFQPAQAELENHSAALNHAPILFEEKSDKFTQSSAFQAYEQIRLIVSKHTLQSKKFWQRHTWGFSNGFFTTRPRGVEQIYRLIYNSPVLHDQDSLKQLIDNLSTIAETRLKKTKHRSQITTDLYQAIIELNTKPDDALQKIQAVYNEVFKSKPLGTESFSPKVRLRFFYRKYFGKINYENSTQPSASSSDPGANFFRQSSESRESNRTNRPGM